MKIITEANILLSVAIVKVIFIKRVYGEVTLEKEVKKERAVIQIF